MIGVVFMTEKTAKMAEGSFTPELIAEMESKKGLKLRVANAIFNEYATEDNIRKYVNGIGDINPLYRDKEYAAKSRYGGIIAPPAFIFSISGMILWRILFLVYTVSAFVLSSQNPMPLQAAYSSIC